MQKPSLMIEDDGLLVTASPEEAEQLAAYFSGNGILCYTRPGTDERHIVDFGSRYDLEQIVHSLANWSKRGPGTAGSAR
jgi:hypothetical protein